MVLEISASFCKNRTFLTHICTPSKISNIAQLLFCVCWMGLKLSEMYWKLLKMTFSSDLPLAHNFFSLAFSFSLHWTEFLLSFGCLFCLIFSASVSLSAFVYHFSFVVIAIALCLFLCVFSLTTLDNEKDSRKRLQLTLFLHTFDHDTVIRFRKSRFSRFRFKSLLAYIHRSALVTEFNKLHLQVIQLFIFYPVQLLTISSFIRWTNTDWHYTVQPEREKNAATTKWLIFNVTNFVGQYSWWDFVCQIPILHARRRIKWNKNPISSSSNWKSNKNWRAEDDVENDESLAFWCQKMNQSHEWRESKKKLFLKLSLLNGKHRMKCTQWTNKNKNERKAIEKNGKS